MFNLTPEQVERAKKLHAASTVIDTHNDSILSIIKSPPFIASDNEPRSPRRTLGERSESGQIDIPRIIEGGVNCMLL